MQMVPFDKRDGVIWLNGSYREWNETKIHVLNHRSDSMQYIYRPCLCKNSLAH